jgi:hypothetical protein
LPVVFQRIEKGRGLIGFLFSLTHDMAVHAFFLLRADLNPHVHTLLVSLQVTAKEPAVAISLKDCSARLTGYAVVIALPSEMLTDVHVRS